MTRVRAFLKGTENHLLADLLGKWHDHSMLHLHKKKWKCYEGLGLESERSKFKSCLVMNCEIWVSGSCKTAEAQERHIGGAQYMDQC